MIYEMGQRLRELRENIHLSQSDAASMLKISPPTLNAYEKGGAQPTTEVLLSLAKLYQTDVDFILGIKNSESIPVEGLEAMDIDFINQFNNEVLKHINKIREK